MLLIFAASDPHHGISVLQCFWNILWPSCRHSKSLYLACIPRFYLEYILAFFLAFDLAFFRKWCFFLAFCLAFYRACIPTFFLAFYLPSTGTLRGILFLPCILTFCLVYLLEIYRVGLFLISFLTVYLTLLDSIWVAAGNASPYVAVKPPVLCVRSWVRLFSAALPCWHKI